MNKTSIEWCDSSWNPVTGCMHSCPYCYARKIAERFRGSKAWPNGFEPTLHMDRMDEPQKITKPQTIFVCSMADLFGRWIPDAYLALVSAACKKAPWHTYIFLTKNPQRYHQLSASFFQPNMWFGASVTRQEDYDRLMAVRSLPDWINTFVSFEPLFGDMDIGELAPIRQVIVGAQTNPTVMPEFDAILEIQREANHAGAGVFCKDSLAYLNAGDRNNYFRRELAWPLHKPVKVPA